MAQHTQQRYTEQCGHLLYGLYECLYITHSTSPFVVHHSSFVRQPWVFQKTWLTPVIVKKNQKQMSNTSCKAARRGEALSVASTTLKNQCNRKGQNSSGLPHAPKSQKLQSNFWVLVWWGDYCCAQMYEQTSNNGRCTFCQRLFEPVYIQIQLHTMLYNSTHTNRAQQRSNLPYSREQKKLLPIAAVCYTQSTIRNRSAAAVLWCSSDWWLMYEACVGSVWSACTVLLLLLQSLLLLILPSAERCFVQKSDEPEQLGRAEYEQQSTFSFSQNEEKESLMCTRMHISRTGGAVKRVGTDRYGNLDAFWRLWYHIICISCESDIFRITARWVNKVTRAVFSSNRIIQRSGRNAKRLPTFRVILYIRVYKNWTRESRRGKGTGAASVARKNRGKQSTDRRGIARWKIKAYVLGFPLSLTDPD